jgi:hypothetical protein
MKSQASDVCDRARDAKRETQRLYFTLAEIPFSQKITPSSVRLAGVAKWQTQGT